MKDIVIGGYYKVNDEDGDKTQPNWRSWNNSVYHIRRIEDFLYSSKIITYDIYDLKGKITANNISSFSGSLNTNNWIRVKPNL